MGEALQPESCGYPGYGRECISWRALAPDRRGARLQRSRAPAEAYLDPSSQDPGRARAALSMTLRIAAAAVQDAAGLQPAFRVPVGGDSRHTGCAAPAANR